MSTHADGYREPVWVFDPVSMERVWSDGRRTPMSKAEAAAITAYRSEFSHLFAPASPVRIVRPDRGIESGRNLLTC